MKQYEPSAQYILDKTKQLEIKQFCTYVIFIVIDYYYRSLEYNNFTLSHKSFMAMI